MTIQEAIRHLSQSNAEIYCKVCKVDSVDEEARTADVSPIDESAPILGVNLQAVQESKTGIVAIPKTGSDVVVAFLTDATAVVVLMSDIDKIIATVGEDKPVELAAEKSAVTLKLGDTIVDLKDDKSITFNGGDNGGLVIIQELRDSLNSLKTYCETMKEAVSAGLKAVGASTSANGASGASAFDTAMISARIEIKNMENTDINH